MADDPREIAESRWRRACVALLILAAIAFAWIHADYGITWDESVQARYGKLVLDYFVSAGHDRACNEYENLFYYGPLFDVAAAAAIRAVGGFEYEIRHALTGLAAWLTLVAVWRFGRLFGSARVAFFGVWSLLMMPRFVGHAFNNPKDIPFACAFAWAMVGIGRLLTRRTWSWTDGLLCGAGIGLALSVRVGAMMLFPILGCALVAQTLLVPDERRAWRERPAGRSFKLLALVAVAWSLMVAGWPWAHAAPLTRPFAALSEMSDFSFSYTMLFAGELVRADSLSRLHVPLYLAITTPLAVGTLALGGLGVAAWRLRPPGGRETTPALLVLLWLVAPLAYVIVMRPVVYDGIRHFLFVLPALAILAGIGAGWILRRVQGRRGLLAAGLLVVLLGWTLRDEVALHPYQSSFFNAAVGGIGRAWRSYDTDYWASSYREAVSWVRRDARERGRGEVVVAVACNAYNRECAAHYLPDPYDAPGDEPYFRLVCVWNGDEALPPRVDYFVGMLRYGKASTFFPDWPVVRRIGRQGAVFSVVKKPAASG